MRTGAGQWYADVPLNSNAPTSISVSLQNGGRVETKSIEWVATNVFDLDDLEIRTGDSLKLSAKPIGEPGGVFELSVDGQSLGANLTESVVHQFEAPGNYVVNGIYTAPDGAVSIGSLNIKVVGIAQLAEPPAIWAQQSRSWTWAALPDEAIVEASGISLTLLSSNEQGRTFTLNRSEAYEDISIVARLGQGGPILATVPTYGFWLRASVEGYLTGTVIDEDTNAVSNQIFTYNLPDSAEVKINVFKAGVVLDDGTRTRYVTGADFDDQGRYFFTMLRPNSVNGGSCHRIEVYQGNIKVGTR